MSVVIHPQGYILSTSVRFDKNVEPTQKKNIKFKIIGKSDEEMIQNIMTKCNEDFKKMIDKYNEEHKDEIEERRKKSEALKIENDRLRNGNYIEYTFINSCKPFCMMKCISKDYFGWNHKKEVHQYTFNLQCDICKIHSKRRVTYTREEYRERNQQNQ